MGPGLQYGGSGKFQKYTTVFIVTNLINFSTGDEFESLDNDGDPTYIYSLKFCPKQSSLNVLAMGSEEGIISLLDTSQTSLVKNEFQAHRNAIFDVAWVPGTENKVSLPTT